MKISDEFEIRYNGECWELAQYIKKRPTHLHPNPKGTKKRLRWYPSLEQAALSAADLDAANIQFAESVRDEMAKTREAIVAAIGAGTK